MPSNELQTRLQDEIMAIRAIDCHSHVPPDRPHAQSLGDLLGYHYYTELAHSAGMPAEAVAPSRSDEERTAEMVSRLETLDNTVQYSWLMEAVRELFAFRSDRLTSHNWTELAEVVAAVARQTGRHRTVMAKSNIDRVFLTNKFDEELSGIDRSSFVPCLRTDDLVFQLDDPEVRRRLSAKAGIEVRTPEHVREAVGNLMRYFTQFGAASAAISLPPSFVPRAPDEAAARKALTHALRGKEISAEDREALSAFVFDAVAEACLQFHKPFQLMIGVLRNVYPAGVDGGRDLLSQTGSLIGYADLFNRYPEVDFTVSVLSASWSHELATMAWIFPNCKPSGHWWYANIPAHIEPDLRARLESVPKTKLIGYYSDMYKVEFGLPKFNMYRRCLARVLSNEFVATGRLTETQAVGVAQALLRDNPKRIFGV
jgi:glucuronate isomerase